jgi:hypothetical protein
LASGSLRAAVAGVVLVTALASAACDSLRTSGYQYVRHRDTGTYFKVPDEWRVYGHRDVVKWIREEEDTGEDPVENIPFFTTFDGHEKPSIGHFFLLDAEADRPTGTARVQELTEQERDSISLGVLRSTFIDFEQASSAGRVDVLRYDDVKREGGYRGNRLVFDLRTDEGVFTVDQSTLLDEDTRRLYVFAIGCRPECYRKHRKVIDEVVTSFKIKER